MISLFLSVLLVIGTSPQSHEQLLAEARRLAEEERWSEAERVFRQAARADPTSPLPFLELGELFLRRGQPLEALQDIDRALERSPADFRTLFLRGLALMQLGKFPEAALELATALEKKPDDISCRQTLALAHLRSGDPAKAAETVAPLLESDSHDPAVQALYGNALAQLGRNAEAIPYLEKAVELDPERVQAPFFLGQSLLAAESAVRLGRLSQAMRLLTSLLERHPRAAAAWYLKGLVQAEERKYKEAASSFQKSIDSGYAHPDAYLNLGIALDATGDRQAAHAAIDQSLERDPQRPAAHYYKALLTLQDGEALRQNGPNPFRVEVIKHLDRAASLVRQPSLFVALGEAYLQIKEYGRVIEAASKATTSPRVAPQAHFLMGVAQHKWRRYDEAEASYKEAIKAGLDTAELYLNLGRMYLATSRFEESKAALASAFERDPDSGAAHLQMGVANIRLGDYETALRYLERATELLPADPEVWYQEGVAEAQLGRSEAALASWRRTLELDPERTSAYFRLGQELVRLGETEEGKRLLAEFQKRSEREKQEEQLDERLKAILRTAWGYADERRDSEALAAFKKSLELAPNAPHPYLLLAEFYLSRGETAEAEAILQQGLERLPGNIAMHKLLITAYDLAGDQAAAEAAKKRLDALTRKP